MNRAIWREESVLKGMLLTIPRVPVSMNKLLGRHWREKHRQKTLWSQELRIAFGPGPPPKPERVRVTITLFHSREYDQDNAVGSCKIVLDAMKTMGFIRDDSPTWLEYPPVGQEYSPRNKHRTEIMLEYL